VRLAFEYAGHPYDNVTDSKVVVGTMRNASKSGHPPAFAPPMLQVQVEGKTFTIAQTPAILNYLAPKLGLDGTKGLEGEEAEIRRAQVNQVVLTALDVNNIGHDVHHPVGTALYYEDQIPESKRAAESARNERFPKFLEYFASVLKSNAEGGESGYLFGNDTTTADLALFHVLTGLEHAFPRRTSTFKKDAKYAPVFKLKERIENTENIKNYLASDRRKAFGNGIWRHYPELDDE